MRRALLVIASLGVALSAACRTTQPPGTEDAPAMNPPGQEQVQTVPAEPPGPAAPLPSPPDGGTPEDGGTPADAGVPSEAEKPQD